MEDATTRVGRRQDTVRCHVRPTLQRRVEGSSATDPPHKIPDRLACRSESVSLRLPNAAPRHPSRGHSAGFLTFEAVVTYPFHPMVGQTVLVIGDHEHDGIHHLLIRQAHGGSYQVPDWMFDPAASGLAVVRVPRLPVSQLMSLRSLVDHLVACSPEERSGGGTGNEKVIPSTSGLIRRNNSARRTDRRRAPDGGGTAVRIADGSSNGGDQQSDDLQEAGGRQ